MLSMHLTNLFSLLATSSVLVSAFPTDFEAENTMDILTGRSIGSACSTPVYRSCSLQIQYCVNLRIRMDQEPASQHLAALQTASV